MKKYVILGGNGPFGVHTACYLLENAKPSKVICVGRNPEKPEPFTLGVGRGDPRYAYHQIHMVYEQDRLFELFDTEKPDVIINYAALAHASSWKKSWRFYDTNITALAKITEQLTHRDYLERWVQIGSSEVYGSVTSPVTEDAALRPTSPYSVSKAAADLHLVSLAHVLNFPMTILRPSNAYAPGQQLHRVIPRAVLCGLTGSKLPLHGGGRAKKSYIHARDLARAIHLVCESAPLGSIYNVGPKGPVTIRDIVALVADAMNVRFEELCQVTDDRMGEDSQYWIDSTAIQRDLDWRPEVPLTEGIQEMVDWGRTHIDALRTASTEYVLQA
ncbi:MAG: GDP-mannose 4,6-dehydratase [Gemmataceae bacterium]|nr:GDP-mannose 4,6-dehydratase [Gemmataceae bacterium]